MRDAFWTCPLDPESRDVFAFEWEDPDTGRKSQFRWTALPQGYTESPNVFGQILEQILEKFEKDPKLSLIQYVDDLLLSGEKKQDVEKGTNNLLNYLASQGLRVSKNKLRYVEREVKYLGHLISKGSRKITPSRIEGIITQLLPKDKKALRKFLELVGYCRQWIVNYAETTKPLYSKLIDSEPWVIKWSEEEKEKFQELKEKLEKAPVLSLPDLEKTFHLFVAVENGVAKGVLAQKWGGLKKPVAFLSKLMDPVIKGWPVCVQAIVATALLVQESRKISFGL